MELSFARIGNLKNTAVKLLPWRQSSRFRRRLTAISSPAPWPASARSPTPRAGQDRAPTRRPGYARCERRGRKGRVSGPPCSC